MMRLIAADLGPLGAGRGPPVRRGVGGAGLAPAPRRARGPRCGPTTRAAGSAAAHQAEAERDAVALYLADHLMGRDSLLLAGTNEEAAKLAGMVRAELARLGQVPERPEVTLADGNGAARG